KTNNKNPTMHQFIHINSYSLTTPKKAKEGGHSVKSIVAEANRVPGNHPHVKEPLPPVLLHGKSLDDLEQTCESWAASMTDAKGRKLRKDALCLVAGVVSAPAEIGDGWQAFRDESVAWLKRKYGDQLQTVVEHTDEDQPHIHFYVVPKPGARFETIHEGRAASDAIKGTKVKASKEIAYNAAMTRFQDDFGVSVAQRHGMDRLGPGAPRVSRAEAVKRKETRKELGAQLVREVKVAVEKGERRGFAQGKAAGVVAGEAQGIEQAKAEFEKKSLFAKVADFIKGLTRENDDLRRKLETSESARSGLLEKFDNMKTKAVGYFNQLKKVMPELERLRSKEVEFTKQEKQVQNLLSDLAVQKAQLSSAKDRISVLTVEVENYREKEKAEELEKASKQREIDDALKVERGLATLVKRSMKRVPENSSIDLG
uniref:plasmid recombination protein n=2 Tax=Pseudomonas abietaniphila TaxID=89065 RepID=UPI000B0ACA58